MFGIKTFIKNIIKTTPPLERLWYLYKQDTIDTKNYAGKIKRWFGDTVNSSNEFKKKLKINNLIISLTTFPPRINYLEYTLFSLIQQTVRPEKTILWLSEKEFPGDIPDSLKRYSDFGVEVRFVKDNHRSYKKLIYSLREYPEYVVVTADDDLYYKPDWLEMLITTHRAFPQDIVAHRARNVAFIEGHIAPYKDWQPSSVDVSYLNFSTGCGGVLYPPGSLYPDVTKSELFMEFCPFADDIWFYVMALLQKTKIRQINAGYQGLVNFDYAFKKAWKKVPELQNTNVGMGQNDVQLQAVLKYYNLYDSFIQTWH